MTFLYPLGLLGLIGIPILIIIYIIKSKYTEQLVASTYLWTLSEKFLKRKNPISRMTGLISLILQLLAVLFISLAIAHPIVTIPNAANEYCFVLDGTGSMNMVSEEGKTRFEMGKEKISELVGDAVDGSRFSLVYYGDGTRVVFEGETDKEKVLVLLDEIEPSHCETDTAEAISEAQKYFNESPSILTYLVTDTAYAAHGNVEVINVAGKEKNAAINSIIPVLSAGRLNVSGNAISYLADATFTVKLYVDDAAEANAVETVEVKAGESTPFELACQCKSYKSIKVVLESDDSLALDNEVIVYNVKSGDDSYKILAVSPNPFFIRSALSATGYSNIDVMLPDEYTGQSGYGLYIFDSYDPSELPRDGAVWIINPSASVDNSGFSVQGDVTLEDPSTVTMSKDSSSVVRKLTAGVGGKDIYITRFVKCGLYRKFTPLFTYQGNPVVFTGTNTYGNREVVFAFSLQDSNLPVLVDFIALVKNFMEYSFPEVIEKSSYYCGDELSVNVIANCDSIRVDSPGGKISYLDTAGAISDYTLTEVGTYTVTVTVSDNPRVFKIYSELPESERLPQASAEDFSLTGTAEPGGFDGTYDSLLIVFICLAVIFAADWAVYCYEKYQLR
ncbi:MAG: VWA domain-containing protein [Clostridia bacterium]|nr:VWA domain-containing protein [Clostridia bacterium]